MLLYCTLGSTFSRRVRIALAEKATDAELVIVNTAAGENRQPPYLAVNPYGRVPTIDHDGFVLYESTAILQYIERIQPTPPLFPSDARANARVHMHMKLCDLELTRYAGAIIFPKRFRPPETWDEAAFAEAKGPIERHLAIVGRELGTRDYLVGDAFTAADLVYLPHLHFLHLYEVDVPANVAAWAGRLSARPSAIATVPAR